MPSPIDDLDALRSKVESLSEELAETKEKLNNAQAELARTEALHTEAEKCSVELRKKVRHLAPKSQSLYLSNRTIYCLIS